MHEKNPGLRPREVSLVRLFDSGEDATASFITDDTALNRRPAGSPDGEWVAWQTDMTGNDEVFMARIDGTEKRNLTNHPALDGHPWFSRDGRWLVFESDRSGNLEIWKLDLSTLKTTRLTRGDGQYSSRTLAGSTQPYQGCRRGPVRACC
jgi:Tol biopolymer transport system component